RQTINVTTYPTNAASTTSLMKWAPLATRVSAHPKARPYHRIQPCGNSRAITAAAAKATAVSLLGSPSWALEKGRSDQARKTWAPSAVIDRRVSEVVEQPLIRQLRREEQHDQRRGKCDLGTSTPARERI